MSTTTTKSETGITAAEVYAEAVKRYGDGNVSAVELGDTYESMQSMALRKDRGVFYTPQPAAQAITRMALEQAIRSVRDDDPAQILRIICCDPSCGAGIFLVEAVRLLAANYAGRLTGGEPSPELVFAVTPTVILWCVYGVDIDPTAAELTRIALSIETGGVLSPAALERHVICGNVLDGDSPPALEERRGGSRWPGRMVPDNEGQAAA